MNFFSKPVPMDVDVNVPIHAVPIHAVPIHSVPMQVVPKHVTFVTKYAKPTQVAHYVYSNSMIIDEHPNKVILR